jgi:uncharacterized protein YciI
VPKGAGRIGTEREEQKTTASLSPGDEGAQHMHFLLIYDLAPDYLERRGDFRAEHLKLAWQAGVVLGGALGEPTDRALLLFEGDSPDAAKRFANADPYVRNGLVKRWEVRPWTTVVGKYAAMPVRPE